MHVHYQDDATVVEVPGGTVILGKLPKAELKLVDAWIKIHRNELFSFIDNPIASAYPMHI